MAPPAKATQAPTALRVRQTILRPKTDPRSELTALYKYVCSAIRLTVAIQLQEG